VADVEQSLLVIVGEVTKGHGDLALMLLPHQPLLLQTGVGDRDDGAAAVSRMRITLDEPFIDERVDQRGDPPSGHFQGGGDLCHRQALVVAFQRSKYPQPCITHRIVGNGGVNPPAPCRTHFSEGRHQIDETFVTGRV